MKGITNCDFVRMLAEGNTVDAIAKEKKISVRTLHDRVIAIKKQTGTNTIAGIVAYYFRKKIIE